MTPEQFCYWMQGFVELSGGFPPTSDQWQSISEHLQQVFNKRTPPVNVPAHTIPRVDPSDVKPYDMGRWPETGAPWTKPTDIIC